MINLTLLWLLALPVLLGIVVFFASRKIYGDSLSAGQIAIQQLIIAVVMCVLIAIVAGISSGVKTHDTEIWNGQITGKSRVHDSYKRPYDCNCRDVRTSSTDSNGKTTWTTTRVCDTCYEDRYTVKWTAKSTLRNYQIAAEDQSSKRVYLLPDPARYTEINEGDPVSITNSYTNYIKAVPETLFSPLNESVRAKFANMIPAYPEVYDFYKINRVIPVGVKVENIAEWNKKLSLLLRKLGPQKQANVNIILVNSQDPNYFFALQDAWKGAKKNDIVLVIGVSTIPGKALWVNTIALTDNNLFKIKLRDDIIALESIDVDSVIEAISRNTLESYKRKSMKDFKYLENEIDPPDWLVITIVLFVLGGYGLFLYVISANMRKFKRG